MAGGLFGGVDFRSQSDILRDNAAQQRAQFEQSMPQNMNMSDQNFYRLGGMLGQGIQQRFMPQQLSDAQKAQSEAVQTAKTRFDDWKKANPDATLEDQGLESQRYLGEELIRRNDPAGMQIAAAYAEQKAGRRKADLEERRLNADIDQAAMETRRGWSRMGKESIQDIYLPGSQFGDEPVSAYIGDDHNAYETKGGNLIAKSGQYFTTAPPDTTRASRMRPSDFGINTSEAKFMRDQAVNIESTIDNFLEMKNIMAEAAKTGSIEFLSTSGTMTGWAVNLIDNATAVARTLEKAIADDTGTSPDAQRLRVEGVEDDLSTEAGARKYVEANADLVASLEDYMPESVRNSDALKQRWTAAYTRTAYAFARALDPGQRGVSNDDFKHAVIGLGASTTNPEAFRQITNTTVNTMVRGFQDRLQFLSPEARESVLYKAGLARFDARIKTFDAEYKQDFGQANAPGQGLRGNDLIKSLLEDDEE